MSLDVYLTVKDKVYEPADPKIYIREDGQTKEISMEEWKERNPGLEPVTVSSINDDEVYSANITHNLNHMADKAGLYKYLWCATENGITKASQLIEPLKEGLAALRADPEKFKELNPPNGWGTYEGLISFTESYLNACIKYPDADIYISK